MQHARKGFTLVRGGKSDVPKTENLRTGGTVLQSGIYRVLHSRHSLPKEVTLIREQSFPRCSKCDEPVAFELIRAAADLRSSVAFHVDLYELPELTDDDDALAG